VPGHRQRSQLRTPTAENAACPDPVTRQVCRRCRLQT
jgi:hypothetical protein